jgi:uncharacterized protein (DUF488 family)
MTSGEPEKVTVWTIGHSNHPLARLVELLAGHGIEEVVDVRRNPYSRFAPQHNRPALTAALAEHGLHYLHLGRELGGKPREAEYYLADGRVDWERLKFRPEFQEGLRRLIKEAASRRVCLMCSEGDPLKCHRTMLLAPELAKRGVKVLHILPDGSLLDHQEVQQPQKPQQMRFF